MKNDSTITIGKITATHGINGWVVIQSYSHPPENIMNYKTYILINNKPNLISILQLKVMPKKIIAQLKDFDNINISEKLIGLDMFICSSEIPLLNNGEYYWKDIEGLRVVTTKDEYIGLVDFVFNNGSNDVLAIKQGSSYIYIAYVSKNLTVVPNKEIIINHETI